MITAFHGGGSRKRIPDGRGRLRLPEGAIRGFDTATTVVPEPAPVRVLFVVSAGRSGSTLLERLLGQSPGVTSVGELYGIWEVGLRHNVACGCGRTFRACPFWREVLADALGGLEAVDAAAMEAYWRRNGRLLGPQLPRLLTARGRRRLRPSTDYAAVLDALYRGIAARSPGDLVVDTSKSAFHPYYVAGGGAVTPYVLHLVRDPRAVAYSWSRPKPNHGYPDGRPMPTRAAAFSAAWWVATNALAARLGSDLPGHYRLVRYEDLVADPEAHLEAIADFCGIALDPAALLREAGRGLTPTHTVWGNPMRFDGRVRVAADERWKRAMPARDRRIVTALTAPWLRRYGYRHDGTVTPAARAGPERARHLRS